MSEPARSRTKLVEGPYFDDLERGQTFDDAPAVTLTDAHAAFHSALFGDRMRLPLDQVLCQAVTGREELLVHPNVVCNLAIGQTTPATQRVKANLFYRGLLIHRPVFVGDTLRTTTQVAALRQIRARPDRRASGLAVLEIDVRNQRDDSVMHFWRCPMLPCRDPEAKTGAQDLLDATPEELNHQQLQSAAGAFRLEAFRSAVDGPHFGEVEAGSRFVVEARDTITAAPELARLTGNIAQAHTDAGASAFDQRLVYGGHTISMSSALVVRGLPNLVTILAWRSCDHTAPVYEGDILSVEFTVYDKHALPGGGGLVDLHVLATAERSDGTEEPVLDWRVVGLMA